MKFSAPTPSHPLPCTHRLCLLSVSWRPRLTLTPLHSSPALPRAPHCSAGGEKEAGKRRSKGRSSEVHAYTLVPVTVKLQALASWGAVEGSSYTAIFAKGKWPRKHILNLTAVEINFLYLSLVLSCDWE